MAAALARWLLDLVHGRLNGSPGDAATTLQGLSREIVERLAGPEISASGLQDRALRLLLEAGWDIGGGHPLPASTPIGPLVEALSTVARMALEESQAGVGLPLGQLQLRTPRGSQDGPVELFMEEWHNMRVHSRTTGEWRMKDRLKTLHAMLAMCLNIGVDPPDVMKVEPCARMECWIDPFATEASKALENVGKAVQIQYERWQSRAQFKLCLDPTVEEIKKTAIMARRQARRDRVLFHYNGHGVPRPTRNGELWVFNKTYTQYIPLSIVELQQWIGAPGVYVFDCSSAGNIVDYMLEQANAPQSEEAATPSSPSQMHAEQTMSAMKSCIMLGAVGAGVLLPQHHELPADLFTSCLTTPIQIALKWYVWKQKAMVVDPALIDEMPGSFNDRKTPLGELNWIFTAVTDTIAWNVLDRDVFHQLFRQDLLLASLFRNFLLAERIFTSLGSSPVSWPRLPSTAQHPMWEAWDRATDICLSQLALHHNPSPNRGISLELPTLQSSNSYFSEQLTAFEVWLEYGASDRPPPEQLPIVLQVLLSQVHRARALFLLARFLDMGDFAVNLALSVGIFPYVLKLLGSAAPELRHVLVFIWTKILALDRSCQSDLVRSSGHAYFIDFLNSADALPQYRAMAAAICSVICEDFQQGQAACATAHLDKACVACLSSYHAPLRHWACLALGSLWVNHDQARISAMQSQMHEKLNPLLRDDSPEVRTAAVRAFGALLSLASPDHDESCETAKLQSGNWILSLAYDGCTAVRQEVVAALSCLLATHEQQFCGTVTRVQLEDERRSRRQSGGTPPEERLEAEFNMDLNRNMESLFQRTWYVLLALSMDPFPDISAAATKLVNCTMSISRPSQPPGSPPLPASTNNKSGKYATVPGRSSDLLPRSGKTGSTDLPRTQSFVQPPTHQERPEGPRRVQSLADMNHAVAEAEQLHLSPISTIFYDWSREMFSRPLLEDNISGDEHEAAQARATMVRNLEHAREAAAAPYMMARGAKVPKFSSQIAMFDNSCEMSSLLLFDPKDPLLYVVDDKERISTWDYNAGYKTNCFSDAVGGGMADGPRVSSMCIVNEGMSSLLAVGGDDGVVRVWENAHINQGEKLLTAWTVVPDIQSSVGSRGPGLLLSWQQCTGMLMAGGSVNKVKVWDVEKQLCTHEMASGTEYPLTSMQSTSCQMSDPTLWAGFGDGSLRLFDPRLRASTVQTIALAEQTGAVITCHIPQWRGSSHTLVTASSVIAAQKGPTSTKEVAGKACFWDMRQITNRPMRTFDTGSMTSMAVHNHAPVFACGSTRQAITIFDEAGSELNRIRYHEGFLGQRIGPVSCLAFHPFHSFLAVGAVDAYVALFKSK